MEGVDYKLLALDPKTNGFTCLLRVAPGADAPVNHHLGAIGAFVVEGEVFYSEDDIGGPGEYMFEPAGDIHKPLSPKGCVLFTVFHGPIAGLDDNGAISGIVNAKLMLQIAKRDGVDEYLARTEFHHD